MRSPGTFAVAILVLLWLVAVACATSSTVPPSAAPPVAGAELRAPAVGLSLPSWSLDGSGGSRAAGVLLGHRLLEVFPFLGKGRAIVASGSGAPKGLEDGVSEGINNGSVLAGDLGLKGSPQEIAAQLDSSAFVALIWLEAPGDNSGETEIQLWDLKRTKEPSRILVRFQPRFPEGNPGLAAFAWLAFASPVCGLAWQPGPSGALWTRQGAKFIKIDIATRDQTAVASLSEIPAGGCLLRWVENHPGGGALACFGLAAQGGAWLVPFLPGKPPDGEPMPEFSLPQRAKRFLLAPFQPDSGDFTLETAAGETLGTFTDLVWLQGATGTAFAALAPDGMVWAVRGDLLVVIPGPHMGPCAAITASEHDLYVAEAEPPYRVKSFSLQADQSWLQSAPPLAMPSPVLAMTVATTGQGNALFILGAGQPEQIFRVPLNQ